MSRRAWIAVAVAGLVGLALLCVASFFAVRWLYQQLEPAGGGRVDAFEEGFEAACLDRCRAAGEAEGCEAYCRCRYERMREGRSQEEFVDWATGEVGDGGPSEELRAAGDRADLACGGRLLRSGFLEQCTASCAEGETSASGCGEYCTCTFDYLRRGMSKEEADRWWLEHLAGEEFSPEGQRAFQAAVDHCLLETMDDPPGEGAEGEQGQDP